MALDSGLLHMVARGGGGGHADAIARGFKQGLEMRNALADASYRQQDRNALGRITNALVDGGIGSAIEAGRGTNALTQIQGLYRVRQQQENALADRDFRRERFDTNQDFRKQQHEATQDFRGQQIGLQRDTLDLKRAKTKAEINNPAAKFGDEHKLQKTFQGVTKDFREVRNAFSRVNAAAKAPSAAGDLALIFNFMKILDPGSVVRESEFATAAASGSLGQRFVAVGQKLMAGERLSPAMRQDFVAQAKALFDERRGQFTQTSKQFKSLATRNGFNPDNVVLDFNLPPKAEQPGNGGGAGRTKSGLNFRRAQ